MNFSIATFVAALMLINPLTLTVPVQAHDRNVVIVNNTSRAIIELYGSHRDANGWEEDVLGSDILPAWSRVNVNWDDASGYCIFDFKAIFEDGAEATKFGVNVCEVATFTWYE